ncbi:MAG: pantetheine-phosphate adenylyltransferase [Phycisphaerales bacterium]
MATSAVYAGSFDPPTSGHVWMIQQGAALFDRLVVAVGVNPSKRSAYDLPTRLRWLKTISAQWPNVEVADFGNLYLADYAKRVGTGHILRGIRSEVDFAYEQTMRHINADLNPGLTTVFLMPPREIAEVSSSLVRGLIGPEGWQPVVQRYVPTAVFDDLVKHHA